MGANTERVVTISLRGDRNPSCYPQRQVDIRLLGLGLDEAGFCLTCKGVIEE